MKLVQAGRLDEAIDFFSKAIEIDPSHGASYHNRGETYLSLDRIIEGHTDLQKAKDLQSGRLRHKKTQAPTTKISINDIDNLYDTVFPEDTGDTNDDPLEFDDSFYDYVFSDDAIETEETWDGLAQTSPAKNAFPAILEFPNGNRQEVAGAILFKPTNNDISLLRQDGYVERVIPLEQLECIRIAGMPTELARSKNSECHIEIIETIGGNVYHEAIHPNQSLDNILLGFSTKEQTRFTYSLIPTKNIRKRCQQRFLGDILLEKRFISNNMLKRALDEHQQSKSMKLGKIIAQQSHVLYSTIEDELKKAKQGKVQGLKIGEILLSSGLVNEQQVLDALETQENMQNMKIGQFLVEKGIIQEKEVYIALAEKFRIPFVDLRKEKVSKKILMRLPRNLVLKNEILPISFDNETLKIATLLPDAPFQDETFLTEGNCKDVQFVLTQPTHLRNIINLLYKKIGMGR